MQLKAENSQLKNLIDNLPGDIYWKNKEGAWLGVNIAGGETLKRMGFIQDRADVIGKTDYELFQKETADIFRCHDLEVMQKKKELKREEVTLLSSGEQVIQLSTKRPLWDEKGEVIGIMGNTIDISYLKKMEASLKLAKEKAEAANLAKAEFLRNMEHQLRTPFSGVYSMVEMLAGMESDPEKKEMLEITYTSAKEFLALLTHIIEVARNEMERIPILAKKFDLRLLIEKVISMHKSYAKVKEIDLGYDYPVDIPTIFISDPYRIQRLLVNLVSNALRFTVQGWVRIKVVLVKQVDKKLILRLIVADTGIGIAQEKQELIYEKFYRVYPANQNKYSGAGLGLYIVKQLLDELEGEIDVISYPDKGSTFICSLPLKRPLSDELIAENSGLKKEFFS